MVQVGDRVELSPATDLWMRGAKYGVVTHLETADVVVVRMDNRHVRKLQRVNISYLYSINGVALSV